MANEVQVKLSRSATIGGQTIGGVDELVAADFQAVYKQTVPSGSTNYEIDMPVTVANILVSAIHSTQNLTLLTNSTSAPAQTINLIKNVPQLYSVNEPGSVKTLTTDVTKFYATNSSGADAILLIGVATKQAPSAQA